ncbi:glycine-rich domain-containing protein [Agrobacterium salinitolerans]|uniref:glycine-rich domain-containing protein n=1 Tax=Agrobacterium salinitolerans TaxID=1183413 RepID=UPI0015717537|nr:DUF2612 domain-containing protein [Agrobacterium salinitolerans]
MECPDKSAFVEERIDKILTQYRESPRLLAIIRQDVEQIADAVIETCEIPSKFDILDATGDQLTIIGRQLGWPRCHCIKVASNNTAAATLNLNGFGAIPILSPTGKALVEGDLSGIATLIYTGTSWAMAASKSLFPTNVATFSTPGTTNWTVPDGVFKARVRVWGGGGGGGGGAPSAGLSYAGTGGGGGGYAEAVVSVTPGTVIPVTVGAGGTAGPTQSAGGTGGTSSFGAVLSATGGTRGVYEPASGTQERAGGMGSGPGLNLRAGNGGIVVRDGNTGNALGGPGGNAAGGGGQGGVLSSAAPSSGVAPGGGGGGAGGPGAFAGGPGGAGLVIIEF